MKFLKLFVPKSEKMIRYLAVQQKGPNERLVISDYLFHSEAGARILLNNIGTIRVEVELE